MDVTAMLNTSPEATEQQKLESSGAVPLRNRTPWDAGGYSLPFQNNHLGALTDDSLSPESLMDIDSSKHKLSDSYSSFSSFASTNSMPHSRFSSMSTVSSLHLPNHIVPEAMFTDLETSPHSSKTAAESCSPLSPRTGRSNSQASLSPTLYSSDLPLAAERHFYRPRKGSVDQSVAVSGILEPYSTDQIGGDREESFAVSPRPASPSDAILIKRTTLPVTLSSRKLPSVVGNECSPTSGESRVTAPNHEPGRLLIPVRVHKRAVSAPDFPATVGDSSQCEYSLPMPPIPVAELIVPASKDQNGPSPTGSDQCETQNAFPKTALSLQSRTPCCMFSPNCDTGSPLRKAVSHMFGRNKMCTRRIPNHIWVWYCRKHYQRARYRNAIEWARTLQYDLISRQITRLEEWSKDNHSAGVPGTVKDYRLAVRKREQRRLEAQKPNGDREVSDSDDDEASESQSDAVSNTAVPKWLLDLSGRSYNYEKIKRIIDGIQADLTTGDLSAWPDIEILPNIILDLDETDTAKGYNKRRSPPGAHGRSQSLGSALKDTEHAVGILISQPRSSSSHGQNLRGGVSQKRKRSHDRGEDNEIQPTSQSQRVRLCERPGPAVKQGLQSIQRPVFQSFGEQYGLEGGPKTRSDHHTFATSSNTTPLTAPRPQRYNSLSRAIHTDPSQSLHEELGSVTQHSIHKRSHSDVGGLYNSQASQNTSSRYPYQNIGPPNYGRPAPHRFLSPPASFSSLSRPGYSEPCQLGNIQCQSITSAPMSIQSQDRFASGFRILPSMLSPRSALGCDMVESVKALDLCGAGL